MQQGEQNYWQQPQDDSSSSSTLPSHKEALAQSPESTATPLPPVTPSEPSVLPPAPRATSTTQNFAIAGDATGQTQQNAHKLPKKPAVPLVSWEAEEFIHHAKGIGWFAVLAVFAIGLLAFGIFVLKDWFATIGFVIMVIAIAVVAGRTPRTLHYAIDESGIHVGERFFDFGQFQSFSVQQEGSLWSIILMPSARFKPSMTVYFEQTLGEKIVDSLGRFLPMEKHQPDIIDRLSTKLRF